MPGLLTEPGTSTPAQRSALVVAARAKGVGLDELRGMVGGSVSALSRQACGDWIESFTGEKLMASPKKQTRRSGRAVATRMITDAHVEQIEKLGADVFRDQQRFENWLRTRFNVADIRALGTAARAGQCIFQLKNMLKNQRPAWHQQTKVSGAAAF